MSTLAAAIVGAVLGGIAACVSLAGAWLRARETVGGHPLFALLGYPIGLALVGLILWLASTLGPATLWASAASLVLGRALAVHRAKRWVSE